MILDSRQQERMERFWCFRLLSPHCCCVKRQHLNIIIARSENNTGVILHIYLTHIHTKTTRKESGWWCRVKAKIYCTKIITICIPPSDLIRLVWPKEYSSGRLLKAMRKWIVYSPAKEAEGVSQRRGVVLCKVTLTVVLCWTLLQKGN